MSNTASTPRGAEAPPERVVVRLRSNARRLVWSVLVLVAVAGALGYFVGNFAEPWHEIAALAGAAAVVLLACILPFFGWLARRYTITSRRLIVRSGLFVRVRREIPHSRGYDVTVRRTWVQSAFGSGDVRVSTGAESPVTLRNVPNPGLVQSVLNELVEAARPAMAPYRPPSTAYDDTVAWGGR